MTEETDHDDAGQDKTAPAPDVAAPPADTADSVEPPPANPVEPPPADPVEPPPAEPETPRPSRLPMLLAGVALVIALLACTAIAWLWLGARGPDDLAVSNRAAIDRLAESRDNAQAATRDTERALDGLRSRDDELGGNVDALQRTLQERLRPLESVPGRLSGLEASLAALQGISGGVRDTWLLAEAEYYMEIANAQLQLAGNPDLAHIALELADERIAKVADPGLTDVRRALADELRTLDGLDTPDIEGAALMLASLAGAVDSLPLKNDIAMPGDREVTVDGELSGWDRAMASLRNAMRDVVSVRRTDEPVRPLLPPDAAYFLRSNLTLQFQAARLSLLRGEAQLFEQSLDDAARWIDEYYDTGQTPVSSALETIAELRGMRATAARPDISRSLTLLRRYLAVAAQDREAAAGPDQ